MTAMQILRTWRRVRSCRRKPMSAMTWRCTSHPHNGDPDMLLNRVCRHIIDKVARNSKIHLSVLCACDPPDLPRIAEFVVTGSDNRLTRARGKSPAIEVSKGQCCSIAEMSVNQPNYKQTVT